MTRGTRDQAWFRHPAVQQRIAEAEADFREGRCTSTATPEEAQAHLDRLKEEVKNDERVLEADCIGQRALDDMDEAVRRLGQGEAGDVFDLDEAQELIDEP